MEIFQKKKMILEIFHTKIEYNIPSDNVKDVPEKGSKKKIRKSKNSKLLSDFENRRLSIGVNFARKKTMQLNDSSMLSDKP